jgi:diguanylate cyclase (GGDEF)-like protein
MFLIATVLTLPVIARTDDLPAGLFPTTGAKWLIAAGLVIACVAASKFQMQFTVHRQAFHVSLVDLPLLMMLFYLSPVTVLMVRTLAALIIQIRIGSNPAKVAFNVTTATTGVACANALVLGFTFDHDLGPRSWFVLSAAVFVYSLVTAVAMAALIALLQGPSYLPQYVQGILINQVVTLINVTVGMVALLALEKTVWSLVLLLGLSVVLGFFYRSYAQFVRQHRSLAEIHEITRATTASTSEGRLADVVLGRLRELLQAESATLWIPARGRHPEVLLTASVDFTGLLDRAKSPDSLRRRAFETGEPVTLGARFSTSEDTVDLRDQLRRLGTKDAIVVPLRSGNAVVGTIEVAGRLGETAHFTAEDVQLVETLAAHVGVAIENSRLVDRLRYDANYDALTGLPNRRRVLAALTEAVRTRKSDEVVAILQFDVVGLRNVNESLGHRAGNEVLVEVAERLRSRVPAAALVGRVGEDEFAVMLRVVDLETALALGDRIRLGMREPMQVSGLPTDVDTTVGVATFPDHAEDAETLLQRADVATHAAKQGAGIQAYNAGLESRTVRRLGLAADLRRALENRQIEVFFQPKVALADRRVVGVECLARWEHPVYGAVTPEDFVAVAEHTGQIARLTELILREGLHRARGWADARRPLSVSVNISARSLADPKWPDQVGDLLDEYGVAPSQLTLEVGEEALLGDPGRALDSLRRLRAIGVRLSVDDFGTGYSSLALLRRLPITEVKIDKGFVQGMATDGGDLAIVRAVVDLSRHFNLSVVAEGVESELTLARLTEIGCDLGQGFLFSRPLPYERLDAWLAARTEATPSSTGAVRWLRAVT